MCLLYFHTSKSSQNYFLVKGHWAFISAAQHVPHGLIDGKSSKRVGHLQGGVDGGGRMTNNSGLNVVFSKSDLREVFFGHVSFYTCKLNPSNQLVLFLRD